MDILRRQNTVAHYIVMRLLLDLCEEAVRRMGTRVSKCWWGWEGLDLEGTQVVVVEEKVEGKPEETEGEVRE